MITNGGGVGATDANEKLDRGRERHREGLVNSGVA